jgi:hypothetical protein
VIYRGKVLITIIKPAIPAISLSNEAFISGQEKLMYPK